MRKSESDLFTFVEAEALVRAFELAEANARLENADPSGDLHYESIKARIIAGTLSHEEARAEILEFHRETDKAK